jgi:hypothetical protein
MARKKISKTPTISLKKAKIGNELSLNLNGFDNEINQWSIKDNLHGLLALRNIDKPLYGFYHENEKVDLFLYKDGIQKHLIENIILSSGGD